MHGSTDLPTEARLRGDGLFLRVFRGFQTGQPRFQGFGKRSTEFHPAMVLGRFCGKPARHPTPKTKLPKPKTLNPKPWALKFWGRLR